MPGKKRPHYICTHTYPHISPLLKKLLTLLQPPDTRVVLHIVYCTEKIFFIAPLPHLCFSSVDWWGRHRQREQPQCLDTGYEKCAFCLCVSNNTHIFTATMLSFHHNKMWILQQLCKYILFVASLILTPFPVLCSLRTRGLTCWFASATPGPMWKTQNTAPQKSSWWPLRYSILKLSAAAICTIKE